MQWKLREENSSRRMINSDKWYGQAEEAWEGATASGEPDSTCRERILKSCKETDKSGRS